MQRQNTPDSKVHGRGQHLNLTKGPPFRADEIFLGIFLNENVWIPIKISLKFVPKGSTNNIPALV